MVLSTTVIDLELRPLAAPPPLSYLMISQSFAHSVLPYPFVIQICSMPFYNFHEMVTDCVYLGF